MGTYLVAAKQFSGQVKSSDAEQLWTESRSIREWSAARIAELTTTINELTVRVDAVETRNKDLTSENTRLVEEARELKDTITTLRQQVADGERTIRELTAELSQTRERVHILEAKDDRRGGG